MNPPTVTAAEFAHRELELLQVLMDVVGKTLDARDDQFMRDSRYDAAIQVLITEELVTETAPQRYRLEWARLAKRQEAVRPGMPRTSQSLS
jgi:hypothetical protein